MTASNILQNQQLKKILDDYQQHKDIDILLTNAHKLNKREQVFCYAMVGGEFLQKNKYNDALVYLFKSYELEINLIAAYNLGFAFEILKDEEKMLKYYGIAINLFKCPRAHNQIGKFYLNESNVPILGNTPESYLLFATDHGINQGFANLIILYKDNYGKRIDIRMKQYEKTQNSNDLMNAMLDMLNSGDYFRYITLSKIVNIIGTPNEHILSLINQHEDDCAICLEYSNKCVKTFCNHSFCAKCISIITLNNHLCPMCRKDLFKV